MAAGRRVESAFQPLQRRIQRTVDHRFYRGKYDAAQTLEAFAARLRNQIELDALSAVLGERGRMLQIVPEFYATDITLARIDQLAELSIRHNIPTTFSPLFDNTLTPENAPRALARA